MVERFNPETLPPSAGQSQVVVADSGEEGLEEAGKRRHDAIILDVLMPGIHGLHALERLRNDPKTKNTPVLVTSNMPQDQIEPQATEAGAGYLNKETPIKDIVARILKEVGAT